ncbi:MAG: hypothetical protein QUU85_11260, partial [Candidatus Eisenbacteria bacterium]|nr:hypothetical protein [Candidatus Eisenbacteria bacterium]
SDVYKRQVWLDGGGTGKRTPAAFPCIASGSHEVGVRPGSVSQVGFTVEGDSVKSVDVGGSGTTSVDFPFEVEPVAQPRGVLMEIFTATYCPNCPVADEAGVELNRDASLDPAQFCATQVHVYWGGTDPMHNAELASRVLVYYERDPGNAPFAFFNGANQIVGSAYENLTELYRSKILLTYGQASPAALYWNRVRTEGDLLRADLRFVAVGALAGMPQLHAFYAKDSLQAQNPFGVEYFDAVARHYMPAIDLAGEGATTRGAYVDVPVEFDLSQDTRWDSKEIRLVAFVQDAVTDEVLQMRQAKLRLP